MNVNVYVALVAAVLLSRVVAPLTKQLTPKAASWVLAIASVLTGVIWTAGLGFLALATIGRLGFMGAFGHWSAETLDAHAPVPLLAGLASLGLLAIVLGCVVRAASHLGRGFRRLFRLRATLSGDSCGDLAVIDIPRPEALALPGWPGKVIVTSGMLQALDAGERAVLIAHERSHLRGGHWVFRFATRLGAALLPTGRPLIDACDRALERWADEVAAAEVGDRELAARSVAKAALVATDYQRSGLSLAFAEGAVGDRVEALLAPRRPNRWGLLVLPASLALVAAVTLLEASRELESLFDFAGRF